MFLFLNAQPPVPVSPIVIVRDSFLRETVLVSGCAYPCADRRELKDGNQRVSFAHTLHTPRSPSMTCRGVIAPPEPHAKSTDIKNPEITEGKKGNFVWKDGEGRERKMGGQEWQSLM